jgi:hypothetical protein
LLGAVRVSGHLSGTTIEVSEGGFAVESSSGSSWSTFRPACPLNVLLAVTVAPVHGPGFGIFFAQFQQYAGFMAAGDARPNCPTRPECILVARQSAVFARDAPWLMPGQMSHPQCVPRY